jgi:hypothetical protein
MRRPVQRKIGLLAIRKTLSPTWLACDIANFWLKVIWAESHLAESFSIWLKG